jgi:flavodoxin
MNICVAYFSRTGNTKRVAEALASATNAKLLDITQTQPSELANYDPIIFGFPVEGASPPKEAAAFIATMPQVENKKLILFATYRIFGNERAMKAIEKALKDKGYQTVGKFSKKGMKPELPADFTKEIAEVTKLIAN